MVSIITALFISMISALLMVIIAQKVMGYRFRKLNEANHGICPRCGYDWNKVNSMACSECGQKKGQEDKFPSAPRNAGSIGAWLSIPLPFLFLMVLEIWGMSDRMMGMAVEWRVDDWVMALLLLMSLHCVRGLICVAPMRTHRAVRAILIVQTFVDWVLYSILFLITMIDFL